MRRRLLKRNKGTNEVRGNRKRVLKTNRVLPARLECGEVSLRVQSRIPPQIKGFRGSIMDDTEMISFNLLEKDQFL